MHTVAVLVGSLRQSSLNRRLASALEGISAGRLAFLYPDLDLPLYNEDLWAAPPAGVLALKAAVASASGVLFVTPEFNRSITPVMKNAIDWASRPWGQNSLAGKPGAIVGVSPGQIGTAVAQAHLRSILIPQDVAVMGQPEVYFSKPAAIGEDGVVTDEAAALLLNRFIARFVAWIERLSPSSGA